MRLHALVTEAVTARRAVAEGATVVQLRLKGAPTEEVVALGRRLLDLDAQLVVNDDAAAMVQVQPFGGRVGGEKDVAALREGRERRPPLFRCQTTMQYAAGHGRVAQQPV